MDVDKSELIARYLANVMMKKNVEQNSEIEEWLKNNPSSIDVINTLSDKKIFYQKLDNFTSKNVESESAKMIKRVRKYKLIRRIKYYMSISAAIIAISFLVWNMNNNNPVLKSENKIIKLDIPKIIYDNGNEIALIKDAEICGINEIVVKERDKNSVEVTKSQNEIEYGRLVIPDKTTYTITLSEGTIVHMNANSELVFPTKFTGDVRRVELIGEAYFEIAKDLQKEFIIETKSAYIKVLGTKFNVNTYDLNSTETVLFEGSVAIKNKMNIEKILKPNQIAKISNKGEMEITNVENISIYTAWRNNYFEFSNANIEQVIKELSSWYGVKFKTIENIDASLTARYKRDTDLNKIISSVEIVTGVKLHRE